MFNCLIYSSNTWDRVGIERDKGKEGVGGPGRKVSGEAAERKEWGPLRGWSGESLKPTGLSAQSPGSPVVTRSPPQLPGDTGGNAFELT